MKKYLLFLMCVVFLFSSIPVVADDCETSKHEDEGYYVTVLSEIATDYCEKDEYYVTRSKSTTYYKNGTAQWTFTLTASFRYNHTTSACISASCSHSIQQAGWSCTYSNASISGNQAIGDGTFERKILGITVETKSAHLTITCDKDGNIS